MAEKRYYKRVRVDMKVDYRDDTHADRMGWVMNISKNGMYMKTDDTPEVKGRVVASLDAEDLGKVIRVEGRVVWKNDTGLAVKFLNTDEKELDNLLVSRSKWL